MNDIKEKFKKQERSKDEKQLDYMQRCKPQLVPILTDILNDEKQAETLIGNPKIDETESQQRVEKIRQFLANGQFADVVLYIIQLDALVGHHEEWKSLRPVEQVLYFVALLQSYLFDDYVSETLSFCWFCSLNYNYLSHIIK